MSRTLKISITLNIAFAAVCTFMVVWNLQQTTNTALQISTASATPSSFDWQRLNATDFPATIRHLRASGCPESIIRHIITGEVTESYRKKERDLLSSSSSTSADAHATADSSSSLARLRATRDHTIAALLSSSPAAAPNIAEADSAHANTNTAAAENGVVTQTESTASSPAADAVTVANFTRPVYPAIYAHNTSVAATDAGLARPSARPSARPAAAQQATSATERAIADGITQKFVQAVGPTPQDANDPAYRQRWDTAVQMSDKMYADHFGARALQKRQTEAAVQLAQEQAGMAK